MKEAFSCVSSPSQVVPSAPLYPALHLQSVAFVLPSALCEFAPHATHVSPDVAAVAVLYVSGGQREQGSLPTEVLYDPASHAAQPKANRTR